MFTRVQLDRKANESAIDTQKKDVLAHEAIIMRLHSEIQTPTIVRGAARNSMFAIDEEVFAENGQEMIRFTLRLIIKSKNTFKPVQ